MSSKLTRFQLIEVAVPAAGLAVGQRLYIPDQPQLRTQTNQIIILKRLQPYDNVTNPTTPSGAATVTVANLASSYLVINVAGTETMQFIPFVNLVNTVTTSTAVQRSYSNSQRLINNITRVDWTKSYIQVGSAIAAGVSYMIGVDYVSLPDDNSSILGDVEMSVIS